MILLKDWINWCVPLLASLVSTTDAVGLFPKGWAMAIVIPMYKSRSRIDPGNYRPINLLDGISKLYRKYLLETLESWVEESGILAEEQAGFGVCGPNQLP